MKDSLDCQILQEAILIELRLAIAKLESTKSCDPKTIIAAANHTSLANAKINVLEQMVLGVGMPRRGD